MAHDFHGPWRIVLTRIDSRWHPQRLVVRGSDGVDHRHRLSADHPFDLRVDDDHWTLRQQYNPARLWKNGSFQLGRPWIDVELSGHMYFDDLTGMTVRLEGPRRPAGSFDPSYNDVVLVCTSLDPAINPIGPSPYDFTIPD